ncbi:MAG: tRNA pseudouridine synthase A [Nitrospinaceae bacterium]|nr:MAG: tRNA pseudouridine synthase A [Nitrospinaceae bacterium]
MTRRIKLVVEYEGTRYHGWQVQPNGISIQEVLQDCLKKITKEKKPVIGSGRTDAGVHAQGQVAHFETQSQMTPHQFLMAFNSLLPHDIVVKEVAEVAETFHAQRSAVRKIYRYTILNRDYPSALDHDRCWFIQYPLDIEAMREAKAYLEGKRDFSAFRASNCEARNPVREINKIDICKNGDFIELHFDGNGFLKYMVRNIVGTLVMVGRGKMQPEDVERILESRDRNNAGPTARPYGLCLVEVFYDEQRGDS